jgi:hypothetical protein
MARDRPGSGSDRLTAAALSGAAVRHARWGGLTEAQRAARAAELREIAGSRSDLLAQTAGLTLGASQDKGREYQLRGQAVAELCRLADADEARILEWVEEGRRRAQAARLPSFSRPDRPPRRL